MFNEIEMNELLAVNGGDVWDNIIEGSKFVIANSAGAITTSLIVMACGGPANLAGDALGLAVGIAVGVAVASALN